MKNRNLIHALRPIESEMQGVRASTRQGISERSVSKGAGTDLTLASSSKVHYREVTKETENGMKQHAGCRQFSAESGQAALGQRRAASTAEVELCSHVRRVGDRIDSRTSHSSAP